MKVKALYLYITRYTTNMPTAMQLLIKHTMIAILCPYLSITLPIIKLPISSPKPRLIIANKETSNFLLSDQSYDTDVESIVLVIMLTNDPEKVD